MAHQHHGHLSLTPLAPRSTLYQGPFGRICPDLPPWTPPGVPEHELDEYLREIADDRMTERPGEVPGDLTDPSVVEELDDEFSSGMPAGYTYFGQFIDHDITFDPVSSLMRAHDPNGLVNFRTPRLDLDNIYGRGPAEQPYLYDQADDAKLAIGSVEGTGLLDLPRFGDRALIGDMRNDENAIVSQLQLAFLLAHNELVDRARADGHPDPFDRARQSLRWLYQYIVWHDFVKRIASPEVYGCAHSLESTCGGGKRWVGELGHVYNWKHTPFMPVEFSAAAYRFGHSMVRNAYQTNFPHRGFQVFAPIFDNHPSSSGDDLRGFRPMLPENSIQWDWFLDMSSPDPFPQSARKIDTRLSNALSFLHEGEGPANILAFRNLRRGIVTFQLPAGSAMARKYCLPEIELEADEPDSPWYYILKEAEVQAGGSHLGALGSTIVCSVFSGLLRGDPRSWLNMAPCWTPDEDPLLTAQDKQDGEGDMEWTLAAIIRLSGLPVDGDDFGSTDSGGSSGSSGSGGAGGSGGSGGGGRGRKKGRGRSKGRGKGR